MWSVRRCSERHLLEPTAGGDSLPISASSARSPRSVPDGRSNSNATGNASRVSPAGSISREACRTARRDRASRGGIEQHPPTRDLDIHIFGPRSSGPRTHSLNRSSQLNPEGRAAGSGSAKGDRRTDGDGMHRGAPQGDPPGSRAASSFTNIFASTSSSAEPSLNVRAP